LAGKQEMPRVEQKAYSHRCVLTSPSSAKRADYNWIDWCSAMSAIVSPENRTGLVAMRVRVNSEQWVGCGRLLAPEAQQMAVG